MRALAFATMRRLAAPIIALTLAIPAAQANQGIFLRGPTGGEVRALVIGIDAYQHYRPLKGAVADARDIENALRRMGTKDIVTLIDAQADRTTVLREIDRLVSRTQANDLVLLSIAGHGAQEPERVRGSEPDGMENVFLLAGFEPTPLGSHGHSVLLDRLRHRRGAALRGPPGAAGVLAALHDGDPDLGPPRHVV